MSDPPEDLPPEEWGPPADPPSPTWGATPVIDAPRPTRTGYHVPTRTARSKRVVVVLGLGVIMTLVGVAVIVGVLVIASGVSKRTNNLASCRAERDLLLNANGAPIEPKPSLEYFTAPGKLGARRINTANVPSSICADVPAPTVAPGTPGTPDSVALPDYVSECTTERATLITAWKAAKAANAADPKGPRQSYAFYLTNPTPTYFGVLAPTGASRTAADRVPVSACAEITSADLA